MSEASAALESKSNALLWKVAWVCNCFMWLNTVDVLVAVLTAAYGHPQEQESRS